MAIKRELLDFIVEQLNRVRPVTTRRMFGGAGFYADGLIFGLADDESVYFKVDDTTRGDYEALGGKPFRPMKDMVSMNYFELPDGVLENPDALRPWVEQAVRVSRAAASRKPKRTGKRRGKAESGE